jgi:(1->4)-alpha-D-glucan 1-alpha-D-glucosylmutase
MLTTATHDHKHGEDVRARLAVLSEIPDEWTKAVESWFRLNAPHRPAAVAPGDEYQLYQTLVGIWPIDLRPDNADELAALCERVTGWQQKALREAKLQTSWLDPNEQFEAANAAFAQDILDAHRSREFLQGLFDFVQRIALAGALNGLVQLTLRCALPGMPDCYQGTEFWDLSLVDPDNRRPVDYAARIAALHENASLVNLLPDWRDGAVKQALLAHLLQLRAEKPSLFVSGEYQPLQTRGARTDHVLAFARIAEQDTMIVAVPLRCAKACNQGRPLPAIEFWEDTAIVLPQSLRDRPWRHLFDGRDNLRGPQGCAELFAKVPVAVLV